MKSKKATQFNTLNLDILFEDSDIVVVNKPAGVIVHRAPGHQECSIADELALTRPSMLSVGSSERPGVVHRLDIETSGVMVFAKNKFAYKFLRDAFESHKDIVKKYLAVLHGSLPKKVGRLETLIGRKGWDSKRMAVDVPDGKGAVTEWSVLAKKGSLSLVEFIIETGRTHQIRVHSAYMGCPIVGDKLYGDNLRDRRLRVVPSRHLLHAVELSFLHPRTQKRVVFAAQPPDDIIYSV